MSSGETEYDQAMAMNGALGGLAGITANCSVDEPWAALLIGIGSGLVYVLSSKLLVKVKIDDAVYAIPVHFFNDMCGCIATGLFASPVHTGLAYGNSKQVGLFYGSGSLIAVELSGVAFTIALTAGIMTPFFLILNALGMFTVDTLEEKLFGYSAS
jgi:Amt family ammonium transporter